MALEHFQMVEEMILDREESVQGHPAPGAKTQMALNHTKAIARRLATPGAKAEAIISFASSINFSINSLMASPNQLSNDLKAFLDGIQASTHNILALSEALISSDAVGHFVKFPKLPIEIRIKIWKLSLPGHRLVQFYAKLEGSEAQGRHNIGIKQAPHALFQVCSESRQVALEKYSLQLSTSKAQLANTRIDPREDVLCLDPKYLWFSPERDMILLEKGVWSQEAVQLKRIALHYNLWNPTSLGDLFRTFIVVKKLVLHNAWSQQTGTDETVMFVCRVKEGWKQQREELDRLWASNGGKAYAERNKPSLFYNTWK